MQPVDSVTFEEARAKLKWGAEGEFSASLRPQECRALLAVLEMPASLRVRDVIRNTQTEEVLPVSSVVSYLIGDQGDETDAR